MRIAWLSDFDALGSGYQNLSSTLSEGLVQRGNEVKAIGLHYHGQEHDYPFSIIPIADAREAVIAIHNLRNVWQFDILVVALDINLQSWVLNQIQPFRGLIKYVGIMPVEADPLTMSWAMVLLQMDLPLIISQFGTDEAHKANVLTAKHIQLGINTKLWTPATLEGKQKFRKGMFGITDDETFIILTVADNQERKNLSAALEAFRDFAQTNPNSRYVLVTRERNPIGWALRDMVFEYGIQDKVIIMERGMPVDELRMVYGASDCFLLTSKAEGLGLPLLEAMSMEIPCIATNCTGMKELLSDGRGILIDPIMIHRDCFGNGKRYWVYIPHVTSALQSIKDGVFPDIDGACEYVKERTWEKAQDFLNEELKQIMENK